jgi:hypothetical protein
MEEQLRRQEEKLREFKVHYERSRRIAYGLEDPEELKQELNNIRVAKEAAADLKPIIQKMQPSRDTSVVSVVTRVASCCLATEFCKEQKVRSTLQLSI